MVQRAELAEGVVVARASSPTRARDWPTTTRPESMAGSGMTSVLDDPLSKCIREYLLAKRSFEAVECIVSLGKDKPAYDDFALTAFWSMVDGIILALCRMDEDLKVRLPVGGLPCPTCGKRETPKPGRIGKLLQKNLEEFRRDPWLTGDPSLADVHRQDCERPFDRLFPNVVKRAGRSPTVVDLAGFSERVSAAVQPLRDHRNSLIAHRDRMPKPARLNDIRSAFATLDPMLEDLFLVATRGSYKEMRLGGTADPERFAEAFVDLMRGRHS